MEKNNTWNIRRLVDESFVPVTQRFLLKIVEFQHSTFNSLTKQSCQSRPKGKNLSMISH